MRNLLLCLSLLASAGASAATFCARTAAELRTALMLSASNGEADEIRIRQGVYQATAALPFAVDQFEPHGLHVSGGWASTVGSFNGCVISTGNAASTILDGAGVVSALSIRNFAEKIEVPIKVESLTVRNGYAADSNGSGLNISDHAYGETEISVNRVIATGNRSAGYSAAVYLLSNDGFIQFTHSIVHNNDTVDAAPVTVLTNNGASALHYLSVVNNRQASTRYAAINWLGAGMGVLGNSVLFGNTGGAADLAAVRTIGYKSNRYGTVSGQLAFAAANSANFPLTNPMLDSAFRPLPGSPLRDQNFPDSGIGKRDVYGNVRPGGGLIDIGAAEGL
jgi:hypothetical protein